MTRRSKRRDAYRAETTVERPAESICWELLQSCIRRSASYAKRYTDIAVVNEKFALGEPWGARDYSSKDSRHYIPDSWFNDEKLPRIYVNKVGNLNITLAALLTASRPTVKAVPASSEPEDTYRAMMAQNVMENLQLVQDTAGKTHQMMIYAGQHGLSGFKIIYNPAKDAVEWAICTIFNFIMDPACENYQDSDYCVFLDWRSESWAQKKFDEIGETRSPKLSGYKSADGIQQEGVECFELWHKPCDDYPQGVYAYFCDGALIELIEEYPYTFYSDGSDKPEYLFPIALAKMRVIRENLYGHTNFTDAINLQRELNEVNSRIVKMIRAACEAVQVLPKEQQETFTPGINSTIWIPMAQAEQMKALGFLPTFKIPPEIFGERQYYEAKIADVMGLNQITSGAETRSISGRAIENIVELDRQKNSDATKSLEKCESDAWKLTLRLVQKYYSVPRKIKITNGDIVDVMQFDKADIAGTDVRLEPASETDTLTDAKQKADDERAMNQLAPLGEVQGKALGASSAADFAEHTIETYLKSGQTPDLQPDDTDWQVFLDVLQKFKSRAVASSKRDDFLALVNLERGIRATMLARAQGASGALPPGQGAQPPPNPSLDAPPPVVQQGMPA